MKILLTKIILLAAGVMLSFSSLAQAPFPPGFYGNGSNDSLRVLDGETYYTDDVRASIAFNISSNSFSINTPVLSMGSFKKDSMVLIIGMTNCGAFRNWEFNKITDVSGPIISFKYSFSATYFNPQVIQIKQFKDLTVDVGGKLTCHPWDNLTGTGGVISFLVNDSLKIRGLIEANGKGFEAGTPGLGGTAGIGGIGGVNAGDYGHNNPGSSGYLGLTNYGEGIGGAGNGAISGSMHQNNNTLATLQAICCGCLDHSQKAMNLSASVSGIDNQNRILMGASGASADGGVAGDGAGGAGGDSPLCGALPYEGGNGGNGGNSGDGGLGGRGGGVILFKAVTIVFDSLGKIQANGADGVNGGDGENGGQGGVPNEKEGAGGGNGAGGGQAGSGGNAGAPGLVYFIKTNPIVGTAIIKQGGAFGGAAGTPGAGGPPGGEAELGKTINCPLTFLCACTDVWEMISGSVATPNQFDNNINTYTKPNSVCIAITEFGKLSVSCTNLTTGDIFKCEMQQLDIFGQEINIHNPAESLHIMSANIGGGGVPPNFTSCTISSLPNIPNSIFKATTCEECEPLLNLCACDNVWEMINGSVATPNQFDNNINTYTKPNSVCIAITEFGKLSVSCTNLTTGDIFKCEMQQLDIFGQEINIHNPAESLHIMSANIGGGGVPPNFTSCTISSLPNIPTSFFKANKCGCRHHSVQGPPGLPGDPGLPSDSTEYSSDDDPYNPELFPHITIDEMVNPCENVVPCNGKITFTVGGGESPYNIDIVGPGNNNPLINVPSGSYTFDQLCDGFYTIIVTDNAENIVQTTVHICPTCRSNNSKRIDSCPVILSLRVLLEGYYLGGGTLNPCLVNIGANINPDDVDQVTISAMDADYPSGPNGTSPVDVQMDTLNTVGNVTVTFGPAVLQGTSYYIKVNQRNHLETWSAAPVLLSAITSYDFTSSQAQALYSIAALSFDGFAMMYVGDISQDNALDASDFLFLDPEIQAGLFGYYSGDLNGDGSVDATDFLFLDPNIQLGVASGTP